jgi:pSer/pThr/pTyr-binding forkhead associated (FHA) protein
MVEVRAFPFTLGRSEDCDLQLDSTRVSREHAEIIRTPSGLVIRDLGSRNGTRVNGQSPDRYCLQDGDLISVADVELTFYLPKQSAPARSVTQVMTGVQNQEDCKVSQENPSYDVIHSIRAAHERLLCRGMRQRLSVLADLATGEKAGYESRSGLPPQVHGALSAEQLLAGVECRLTERMNQMQRMWSAEQAAKLSPGDLLFVRLEAAEVGADHVPESLSRLETLSGGKKIAATIPESAVVDIPYFRDFLARLREQHVGVAYYGFAGNQLRVATCPELCPEFLMLAPALARGVDKSSQRQEQIREIVTAAAKGNTRIVATGIHTEAEAETCRQLGCQFGEGDHYGTIAL